MVELIKLNFQILWKRGRLLNYAVALTFFASALSIYLYRIMDITKISNYQGEFILLNDNTRTFVFFSLYLLPLFVTIVDGDIGIIERKIYPQIFTRVEMKKYINAKAITEFLVGFLVIFYFLGLMYLFMLAMIDHSATLYLKDFLVYFSNPSKDTMGYTMLFINHPHLYNLFYIFLLSIYGGILSLTSYLLGLFINSKVVAFIGPFVLSILFALGANLVGSPFNLAYPQLFLNPYAIRPSVEGWFSLEIVIPLFLFLYIFFLFAFLQLKKWVISRK
ncbi:MAG: hypothetical protein AB9921_11845 [Erysipelotrichaceae bacterium]